MAQLKTVLVSRYEIIRKADFPGQTAKKGLIKIFFAICVAIVILSDSLAIKARRTK
jgi:hypothetical protein